jgi:ElaA protein
VEQNCVYQDIDGKDKKAMHVVGTFEGKIVAYARIFKKGDYFDNASIGRVVVSADCRTRKWGYNLMETAIQAIETHFNETKITISAQLYLQKFYESLGFTKVSEMYLEDDIPHIEMLK